MQDQMVFILNTAKRSCEFSQRLEFVLDPSGFFLSQLTQQTILNNNTRMTLEHFKDNRHESQLAVYNGYKLAFTLFNKTIAIVETQMSKVELFFKKTNVSVIDQSDNSCGFLASEVRHYKGLLIVYNFNQFNIYDFEKNTLLQKL